MTEENNQRKLRIWDAKALYTLLGTCIEFRTTIEEMMAESDGSLPPSVVPTDMLYNIVAAYEVMYDLLLKEQLIKTGNPKPTTTIH